MIDPAVKRGAASNSSPHRENKTNRKEKNTMLEAYPDVLTSKNMMEILRVSKVLLYKSIRMNQIPAYRVGNKWRFNKEEVINHLNAIAAQNLNKNRL